MIRYSRRWIPPEDVSLFEPPAPFKVEIVVERLCACARCHAVWWAEAGKPTSHRCPMLRGSVERFDVPLDLDSR